jgi:multiple sugar transport system permease protein
MAGAPEPRSPSDWQRPEPGAGARLVQLLDRHIGALFILPALAVLVGLTIYPLVFNVYLALHNVTLLNIRAPEWQWVGLQNFVRVLTDPSTQSSLVKTAIFATTCVTLQLSLGLAGALAFNVKFRGKPVLLVLALVPMMVTPIVVGIAWRMLLNYDWGLMNYALGLVGLEPLRWLSDPTLALVSIILVQVWWGMSFAMLVILGGLASIPRSLYESAEVDGCNALQSFRYITLPMLAPILLIIGTIKIIDALREFDLIFSLTGGGPGGATRVFALELFYMAYERGSFGMSAAQALLLMLLVVLLTVRLIGLLVASNKEA